MSTDVDPLVLALHVERRRRGLSQQALAGLAGITQAQVGRIERGLQRPRLPRLRARFGHAFVGHP